MPDQTFKDYDWIGMKECPADAVYQQACDYRAEYGRYALLIAFKEEGRALKAGNINQAIFWSAVQEQLCQHPVGLVH